jgi:hypothetical protein
MASVNPYVFILGCPRSGTTLLRRMVDAHPQVAIPSSEQHWILDCPRKGRGVTADRSVAPELISILLADRRFAGLDIGRNELEKLAAPREMSYATFVSAVLDAYGSRRRKPLVGDKTPGAVRNLPMLHELWPRARIVHLIRDGRDVCLSLINWRRSARLARRYTTWDEHPVTTAALWWEWHVRSGREAGPSLGAALYHEVRYEALVTDTARELASLCDFLALPYDDAMLRFYEGRQRTDAGLSAKKAWLPPTPGLRDWTTQMSRPDIERFEAVAGDLLDELGDGRAAVDPSPELRNLAATLRSEFMEVLASGGRRVPERWLQLPTGAARGSSGPT